MADYLAYFSPTGGVERLSGFLADRIFGKYQKIDLSENIDGFEMKSDDNVIVALPSFSGRCPEVAIERLKRLKGANTKAVAVAVYGNRAYEDTLLEISDTLVSRGFKVIAGVAGVTEHSILRQYATGRPDEEDFKVLGEYAKRISEKLSSEAPSIAVIPGNRPYRKMGGHPTPITLSHCYDCKLCANLCPVEAISKENPKEIDPEKCIGCMRCVSICPTGARIVPKEILEGLDERIGKLLSGRREPELFL